MTPAPVQMRQTRMLLTVSGLTPPLMAAAKAAMTVPVTTVDQGRFRTDRVKQYAPLGDRPDALACGAGYRAKLAKLFASYNVPVEFAADPGLAGDVFRIDPSAIRNTSLQFRDGQVEFLRVALSVDHGVIEAYTGFGKSAMVEFLVRSMPRAKIDIVCRSNEICEQLYTDLLRVVPGVGRVGGGVRRPGRVTVVTADSCQYTAEDADWLIADEVHMLAAGKYLAKLALYGSVRPCRTLGLTATLERTDGAHGLLEPVFGPVVYKLSYQRGLAAKAVVPVRVRWVRPYRGFDPGADLPMGAMRDRRSVWQNYDRNLAVAAEAEAAAARGQTLVMCKTVEHVYFLKQLLPDWPVCFAPDDAADDTLARLQAAGVVPADETPMTKPRRTRMAADFSAGRVRKAIGTYIWSTGLNFAHLTTLVRADAGAEKARTKQIAGRLTRHAAGKDGGAEVVDFWDDFSVHLLGRSRDRRDAYAEPGIEFEQSAVGPPAVAGVPA